MQARAVPADVDVVLSDGSTVRVRPAAERDLLRLERFFSNLSTESRTLRFFSPVKDLSWAARRFLDVDGHDRYSLVAIHGEDIVGHAFYAVREPGQAEIAFAIADSFQGMGLGTILLGHLAAHAAGVGITEFLADVLPENHRMLSLFRESGFPIQARSSYGVVTVEFPTSLTEDARDRFERREQLAAVAALKRFFEPGAVAVIGASRRRGTIGGEVFHNLLQAGFPGPVYPVSPYPVVQSVPAYTDVRDIEGSVDLAVIVTPAADVVDVARACAEKGVQALVVISAGFAEAGEEGRRRQDELVEVCRDAGIRLIGPNCMGILSTTEEHRINATFSEQVPPPGRVGFMSQSGALGLAVIEHARRLGLGLSHFVSVGNTADISGNDLLEFWEGDPGTDVLILYLESFGNPRRFSRLARRISARKPILVVKSGRTAAGARASTSHTGALLAASDVTVDGLFSQSGVIRADTLGELFDVATLLASQPAPAGKRVGILTNAGGLGTLCADSCASAGLEVPRLSESTRAEIARWLPAEAAADNPVDVLASAAPDQYQRAMLALAASAEVDALIVLFIPPLAAQAREVAEAVDSAAATLQPGMPVLGVFTGSGAAGLAGGGRVPRYEFPEDAARALAKVAHWAAWRDRPREPAWQVPDARRDEARAIVATALGRGRTWLDEEGTRELLACYGIPLVETHAAASAAEAAAIAARLNVPVALKAVGPGISRRTEQGAVALGLRSQRSVRAAAKAMKARLARAGHQVTGYLVQPMVADAIEMVVGVTQDPVFGPVLACGGSRTGLELLQDMSVRLTPLSASEAEQMIRELKSYPLLEGYGGRPVADVGALRELVLRVSGLVEDLAEVVELDLDPVMVNPSGAFVADARIRVESRPPRPPAEARIRHRLG
jgi:acetate---CoA ligase (ADP-forming)